MKDSPKVSLLILNWNGIEFTRKCLHSLLQTVYKSFEIILVDNGSKNNEADHLEKEFKKYSCIHIIKNKKNIGYAAGMNTAYAHAQGKYVMTLNNDMEFSKNWLGLLVKQLDENPKIAACQPKIRDIKKRKSFEYSAAAGGFIDSLGYTFARGRIFSHIEMDKGQYDNSILISWGGILLLRKNVLDNIGFFDPIYFNYAEDVDLCLRIYGAGYLITYEPKSIVYHFGGGAMGKNLPRKMFFIHRNHIILILKNYSFIKLSFILFPRICMDTLSFFYYIKHGYWKVSFMLLYAYLSLITLIPKILISRQRAQKIMQQKNLTDMPHFRGSIVWEYFIRGRKDFRDIPISNKTLWQ